MKFKKEILPVGRYLVSDSSGKKVTREFDESFLKEVATNSTSMIEAGLKIPAPFKHLKEAVPVTEEISDDAYSNAGYWEKIWFEDGSLYGEIEAPGETTDANSPAGKLTSTVQEVSACIKNSWKDGLGRDWGPSMLHGAPVLHPVVPGQEGFELVEDAVALSISGMMETPTQGDISCLSRDLEESGIYLPPETLLEDLPKVLTIALKQKKLNINSDDDDSEFVESRSVFMSLPGETTMPVTKREADHLLTLGAINPKNNKPFTLEDFDIADDPKDTINLSLTKTLIGDKKTTLKKRVESLIETGRTTKAFAESKLYPQIDTYNLSFGKDAAIEEAPIESLIENLEALDATKKVENKTDDVNNLSMTEEVHDPTKNDEGGEMDQAAIDACVKELLENA